MPDYTCDRCRFSTKIKTKYRIHLSTTKHKNNVNKPPTEDEGYNKMVSDNIAILKKEMEEIMKENAELKKQIAVSKQVVIYINN